MSIESKRNTKYVIAVALVVALFAVQLLFSRFGFFISRLFDYSALDPKGIKDTVLFCVAITVYYLAIYIAGSFTNTISTYDYELNPTNVIGTLGFQLLLSGPSEEILFRSLPITLLLSVLDPESKRDRAIAVISAAVVLSAEII